VWGAKPRLAERSAAPQLRERASTTDRRNRTADAGTLGLTGTMEPASTSRAGLARSAAAVTRRCSLTQSRAAVCSRAIDRASRDTRLELT
jgi:hypothetical protein